MALPKLAGLPFPCPHRRCGLPPRLLLTLPLLLVPGAVSNARLPVAASYITVNRAICHSCTNAATLQLEIVRLRRSGAVAHDAITKLIHCRCMHALTSPAPARTHSRIGLISLAPLFSPDLVFSALWQAEHLVRDLPQPLSHKLTHEPGRGKNTGGLYHYRQALMCAGWPKRRVRAHL